MKRIISLDTETTGLSPNNGDRIIEVGCVEMINGQLTGNNFHRYVNPQRNIPQDAINIHGITNERVKDEPLFADIAQDFLDYIGDDLLVIHNAQFDLAFLNAELKRLRLPALSNPCHDTLLEARRRWPSRSASLDALCKRFNVDNSDRTLHGALIDASLLAQVYARIFGMEGLGLGNPDDQKDTVETPRVNASAAVQSIKRHRPQRAPFLASEEEVARHASFLKKLENPLWEAAA